MIFPDRAWYLALNVALRLSFFQSAFGTSPRSTRWRKTASPLERYRVANATAWSRAVESAAWLGALAELSANGEERAPLRESGPLPHDLKGLLECRDGLFHLRLRGLVVLLLGRPSIDKQLDLGVELRNLGLQVLALGGEFD